MSAPPRTQCLVFVLHVGNPKGKSRPCSSFPDPEKVEAFALLPHTVKRDHPEVLALFSQNGVSVVDSDSEYPSLHAGAKNNRVELLELLLDEDGETYGSDTKSLGYLHVAVHTGNRRLAKLLFPRKIIVHPQAQLDLSNARLAIDEENGKFLEQLLANGNDVSYRRPEGGTFLHLAVEQCHESLLMLLVRFGADVNATKKDGWTPLHIAADKGFVRMIERLLRSSANVHAKLTANSQLKNATPLQLAVAKDHVEIARLLLANGSDVDAHSPTGQTVLQLAIERGCLGLIEQLLKHGPDVRNKSNYDAFRLALNETRPVYSDIVARLFNYGFNISSDDISNFAMLRGAVRLNCIPIVLKFLEHDVNLNDHERHGEIRSLLHVAVEHAGEKMVGLLLENGACIESNCYYLNRTPIFAAATKGRLENLKLLLRSGAKVDVKDIFGLTPLLASSENGHPEVVEALLDSGADVNVVCEKCRSALFYAVTNGHAKVAEVLSRFGASSNSRDRFGLTPLHVACTKGNAELVEILLRNDTDVNAQCSKGRTALWLAAEKGFKEVIEQLLESNANVDCRAEGGMTPLHVVARLGSADIANVLLKNGADVNATCYKRRTPLFYAVIGDHFDVAETLLRLGADTDSKDVDHKTPLYAAAVEGTKSWTTSTDVKEPYDTNLESQSVVELLLKFGARLDFILRSKPVVFDLAVFSSTDVFKTVLEFCFVESELFDEARLCELFDATRHLVYLGLKLIHFVKAGDVFAQHVVKVRALRSALHRDLPQPIWYCKDRSLDEFARNCEEELLRLKNENIGDTTILLYDVLTKDSRKVAGFLRNDSIACILKNRGYRAEFPIYAGIIDCQFLKGNLQKELMRQCTRACHFFLSCFRTLPYDVKERILSYLSFADLKSLLRACKIPLVIRSSWFDIFLSEFLIEIKDGKQPSEIVSFSSSHVIASIIAAEFLKDVHNISVQAGNEEFSSLIRQHLLNGRGWRCLAVLQCLGVQDVSYSQELASLFISVFAICNEVSQTEASKNPFISQISKASFRSLDDIIKLKSPRVRKKSNTHALSNNSASSGSRRADSGPGPRSKFERSVIRGPAKRSPESSDTDVVASIPSDPKSTLNKSSLFKLRFNTIELDDFPSMSENDSGDRLMSAGPHKGTKESLNPNDFVSNSVNIVLKNRLNVFEVSHLLINLLSELCLAQNIVLTSSADNLQQLVIVQALNFSLENLCSLQFNAVKNKHYSPSQIYLLKLALLKLLLQIVHKMKDQSTFSAIILNSGVVPILIRLLEDIVPKYQEDKPPVEPQILQEFVFGSLYLLILILDYFLKQKSFLQKDKTVANDKLSNFLQIFHNVIDSHNGKLVYKIIVIILNFPSISFKITDYRIKKLIFLIGEMIVTIKRIRAKINHSEKCKRSKHKQCLSSFLAASSHHHDSFGNVYTNTISLLPNSSVKYTCAVTSLTNLLVKLLNEKMNSELFSYILQVLKMCGTCCCFNISHLHGKFLNILSLDPRCIDLALKVLEEKMFYDLGVIEGISQCKVCFGKVASPTNTDSLSSFVNYKKLFLSAEPKIAKPVAIHLLKLVPFFIKSIQRILLIEVFYPSFVETKSACSLSDLQKAEKSIMANCLSAFIHLINYGQLHEEFMQLGGLKHLEDLITIHDFTKLCALILETIIVVKVSSSRCIKNSTQEYKTSRRSSEAGFRIRSNLIEMTVNEDLQEFEIVISHLKLVQQEFLSILSDCRFESCPNNPEETIHKMSIKESLLNNLDYSHTEKSTTLDVILNDLNQQPTIVFCDAWKLASYTNLLNILSELWRSCTNIILMSTSMAQSFTKLLASQHCSTMTCILLRLISKEFYVKASGESVKLNSLHFKLLEALIPLHLALSPPAEITNMIENELKSSLTLVIKSNRVTMRQICDLLIKCAVKMTNRRPSTASASMVVCSKSVSYIFNGMEEEVLSRKRQMMAFIDERVEEIADEGYEADIEIPTWADSDQDLSERSSEDNCSHRSSSIVSEERKYILLYPQLCILLFDLLCSQQCKEKSNDESTVSCLQKMLTLCKDHPINCSLLSEYNFILRLISGFSQQLSTTHPSPTPLQLILVDFFFHLARHNIQTHHLAAYFELFKNDNPPLEVLLSPLLGLANSMKTQPSYVLNFPLELKDPPRGENPAEKMCNSMCVGHRSAGILSPWNISAVCLPMNIDCGWSMWTDKFSVSLWLRMRNRQLMIRQPGSIYTSAESINSQDSVFFNRSLISSESGESLIHIFSIGHDSFLVEFWGSSISDTLHIRLSLNDGSSQKILTESCVDEILPPSLWHHLAINFKDTIQKMLVVIEVTLIVNGSCEIQIPLTFTGILIKKARPTCILIGDTRPTNNIWSLSNFVLFRSPVFNKELALLLCAYGPDFSCLTESSVGDPLPNFINLIDKKNWAPGNWASVLSKNLSMKNLKSLQESLFVLYSARDPNSFYIYQHSLSSTTGVIAAQPPSLFRISNVDNRASQKVPFSATVMSMSNLCVQKYSGFTQALDALGGLNVLLFLFAKVVELGAEEKYQADALYVLLKMATSNNQLYVQFIKGDSYKLILKVLQSRKAKAGYHILKALFDVACDKPGLIQCQSSNSFFIASQSNHILVHPELLVSVALPTWQQWELKDATCNKDSILCLLFKALHVLISDGLFTVGEFNAEQLNRCALLDAVLNFCKQRFQYKEKSLELEPSVCCSIIELLRGLMGAPPQLNQVKAIFKYVLLAHDDSATYITTARSKFYFLLTSEPPPSGKSSRKRGSVLSSRQRTCNDSNSTSELSISHSFRSKVLDATKLSKALTNLQIQQNMVSKSSSSETNHSAESTQLEDICEFHVDPSSEVDGDVSKWQENRGFESVDEFIAQCEEKNANRALNQYYRGMDHTDSGPKERKVIDPNDIVIIGMDNEFHEDSSLDSSEESNKEKIEKFLAENIKKTTLNQRETTLERSSEYLIMEGLLVLLRDTFLVLPDHMVTILTDKIIDAASLLAMLNHPDDGVRTAVIKVFSAYLQRCSEDLKSKFINRMKGFYHLANQLSLYPNSSAELVETCAALVTGCFWLPLEEQLEAHDVFKNSLSPQQLAAVPTVLAFLPTSISNITLMGNLVHFLHSLYCKVQDAAKQMLSFGLVEVLCKTLVRIAHDCPMQEVTDLVDQLQQFFGSIVTNAVQSPGSSSIHVLNEMLLMICFLESEECLSCGVKSECIHLLREIHRSVLDTAVETIIDMITSQQIRATTVTRIRNTTAAILSSVLSSSYEDDKDTLPPSNMTSSFSTSMSNLSFTTSLSTPSILSVSKPKQISRSELVDRFKIIVNHCMDFIISTELPGHVCKEETEFACHIFSVLLNGVAAVVEKKSSSRSSSNWNMVMWRSRDILRNQAATLFLWLLAPFQSDKTRMFAINTISNEAQVKDILFSLLLTNTQIEQKFILFLWDLMYNGSSLLPTEMEVCEELKEQLLTWDIVSAQAFGHAHDRWQKDVALAVKDFDMAKLEWEKSVEPSITKCIFKWETLVGTLVELGAAMTTEVVESQHRQKKGLLELMKVEHSKAVDATMRWHSIVQQLTHERAVWYSPDAYLRAWQLDPTEGPGRVRNRLQRCNLNIDNRFFKLEYRNKHGLPTKTPLSYLQTSNCDAKNVLLIDKLHTSEKIVHMCTCQIVQPASEVSGELLIGAASIYFIPNVDAEESMELEGTSIVMKFDEIKEYHNRRYQLQERAIEMFLLNGRTYLIAFQSSIERDNFVKMLSECPLPNRVNGDVLIDAVQLWREGLLSNWDYLTLLNKMAGRSYNDLMQYPVMPFILADYTSQVLDLTNPASFRNLKKPMAVQDKKNEQHYIGSYNYLKQELTDAVSMMTPYQEPYHYGSHYSNSGTVLHFLVRVPPFTQMFLNYQDENFDLPDRTFHSLHTTWRLTSSESTTDVKEIIPEFFCLPEFLTNPHGFNFGLRQNGERVDDVQLPPWANSDPRLFILIHRQALESEYVRENLPHWIDLVFGYKQTGKPAVDAINVFHPATYYGFDVDSIPDQLERIAWQTMIRTYGQTPRQLFTAPHPMIVQTLTPKITVPSRPVFKSVKGLQWGSFVGSPAEQVPSVVWRHQHRIPVASLVPLLTNDVFGLAPKTSLLLSYAKERTLSLVSREDTVLGCAVASWGHADNVIRLKLRKEKPPKPIIRTSPLDPVTICASAPDCSQLWVGHESGNITIYRYTFNYNQGSVDLNQEPVKLLGHAGPVLSLSVNRAFSIVLSGSADGSAIIWDLNKLTYVRSVPAINLPINLVSVSGTLGDIVTVGSETNNSILRLHSINVTLIGSLTTTPKITSVCFSTAPEGLSVNVIATGMENGTVKLWSTWDLSPVGEICVNNLQSPIIGLTYSHDSQHLYASAADGVVVIWEGTSTKTVRKTPNFLNLTL